MYTARSMEGVERMTKCVYECQECGRICRFSIDPDMEFEDINFPMCFDAELEHDTWWKPRNIEENL